MNKKKSYYLSAQKVAMRIMHWVAPIFSAKTIQRENGFRMKLRNGQKFTVLIIEEKISDNAFYGVKSEEE